MTSTKTIKLVMSALLAAMTCVATMVIQIPSPTGGYIHLGDGFMLLSGIILGPMYGGAAAGIGSMFADLLSGYATYAPATLVIKAVAAILAGITYHSLSYRIFHIKQKLVPVIIAGICGGIVVTVGYLLFESLIMGNGIAAAVIGVPANIVQNIFGIIVSVLLFPLINSIPVVRETIR